MPAATSVTAEQFLALPDRYDQYGNRIKEELIEGEIVQMAPPSKRHDILKNRIARLLARHLHDINLNFEVLVEIAIEVILPSETAAHVKSKVDAYLANGSESVWVVYLDQKAILVHSAVGIRELRGSESIAERLLAGFTTPVSAFFED